MHSAERPGTAGRNTRSERILGAAGVVLLIGIFAFPWYHVGVPGYTINGQTYGGGSYDGNALQGPGSFFSVVALIVLIALLATFVARRFTSVQLPDLPISWGAAELYAAIAVLALLVIKICSTWATSAGASTSTWPRPLCSSTVRSR